MVFLDASGSARNLHKSGNIGLSIGVNPETFIYNRTRRLSVMINPGEMRRRRASACESDGSPPNCEMTLSTSDWHTSIGRIHQRLRNCEMQQAAAAMHGVSAFRRISRVSNRIRRLSTRRSRRQSFMRVSEDSARKIKLLEKVPALSTSLSA